MNKANYEGDFTEYRNVLQQKNIDFDIEKMHGRTQSEIEMVVDDLISGAPVEKWYFTFGCESILKNRYVSFYGNVESTRNLMMATFGDRWCRQLTEEEFSAYNKYKLSELKLGEV